MRPQRGGSGGGGRRSSGCSTRSRPPGGSTWKTVSAGAPNGLGGGCTSMPAAWTMPDGPGTSGDAGTERATAATAA